MSKEKTKSHKKLHILSLIIVLFLSSVALFLYWSGCGNSSAKPYYKLTLPDYATPLNTAGNDNLYKVSNSLYRSAQPTAQGFKELQKLGIKTIVNLRSDYSDEELIEDTNLKYYHIPMVPTKPETQDVVQFLKIAADSDNHPILVHCRHGSDRTGTMVAAYRIVIQNWEKKDALDEMTEGPFGFHEIWWMLPDFIEELDTESIKKQLNEN